eukprot:tig00000147_g9499.t1
MVKLTEIRNGQRTTTFEAGPGDSIQPVARPRHISALWALKRYLADAFLPEARLVGLVGDVRGLTGARNGNRS